MTNHWQSCIFRVNGSVHSIFSDSYTFITQIWLKQITKSFQQDETQQMTMISELIV